ncbi:LPXTG cell wall anchor domain-containing protein [Dehalobacter sp. DCM]|uniref:LPXTG cell wall anchor domain-containing protein n=1 Tax=Dehalobacter sp. DCM TaxID=2907827 RepID=UPI003081A984|nr:LPXTG cell wall anchor domain-containing protein [Dehalobacter sp. DCM]
MLKKAGILRYVRYFFAVTIIAVAMISLIASQAQIAYGIQTNGVDYGLTISPEGQLFNTTGLAPGRSDTTTMTVTNEGQETFTYDIRVITNDPNSILYQALDFKIMKGNSELYNGKLKDLKIVLGTLVPGTADTYDLTLGLPIECSNEFESQDLSFEFVINASGGSSGGNNDNGSTIQTINVMTPEEEAVLVPDVPNETEQINIPGDESVQSPNMPATGVASVIPYYAAGSAVLLAGVLLIRKKK